MATHMDASSKVLVTKSQSTDVSGWCDVQNECNPFCCARTWLTGFYFLWVCRMWVGVGAFHNFVMIRVNIFPASVSDGLGGGAVGNYRPRAKG